MADEKLCSVMRDRGKNSFKVCPNQADEVMMIPLGNGIEIWALICNDCKEEIGVKSTT